MGTAPFQRAQEVILGTAGSLSSAAAMQEIITQMTAAETSAQELAVRGQMEAAEAAQYKCQELMISVSVQMDQAVLGGCDGVGIA